MRQKSRLILGLIAAALAPQFVIYATSIQQGLIGEMGELARYTLLASFGMTLLCVLPVHLILQRRGRMKLGDYVWTCITAAMLFGVLTGLLVELIGWYVPTASIPLIFGFLAALVIVPMSMLFWFIARPDLRSRRAP